jgi:phosphatidylglycerol lysyltransferase
MTTAATDRTGFERARDLVMRYGWNTTCFQIVNPGIEYWFGQDGRSVVGYVSSGKVRVVAGAPVCRGEELEQVAAKFENDAEANGETVCYFGAEARLESVYHGSNDHAFVLLGAQPVWHPAKWTSIVSSQSSIRAQLNRARNKGVVIREWPIEKATNNSELRECLSDWFTLKGLPPLHFVIEPETLGRLENRRVFVATQDEKVQAFLVLSPIPERRGWLTEQFPHRPSAPNGTVELMMSEAISKLAEERFEYVTLGLSPLSKRATIEPFDNPLWLRFLLGWMRRHGQRFYNFDGLDRFKSKLCPEYWEPIFAISNEKEFSGKTLYGIAQAFTENHPYKVLFQGLGKAVVTEMHNIRRWMSR